MKKNKAFTLIESLIGITLMTVVITAVAGLILSTLLSNQRNLHTLQAKSLAQEGVEIMRYIRDSNWLQNYSWDGGSDLWGGDFDLDIDDPIMLFVKDDTCPPCFQFSKSEEDGYIETPAGFEFLRTITVSSIADESDETQARENSAEVTVTIDWFERGVERSYELSTYLTDWQ